MQPQIASGVYNEIKAFISRQDKPYSSWYCGIASNWENRLFNEHRVLRGQSLWITRQCYDDEAARNVERELIKLGCDGGGRGGDAQTVYVYAYLKSAVTNP